MGLVEIPRPSGSSAFDVAAIEPWETGWWVVRRA
jgi:hypothetical protein